MKRRFDAKYASKQPKHKSKLAQKQATGQQPQSRQFSSKRSKVKQPNVQPQTCVLPLLPQLFLGPILSTPLFFVHLVDLAQQPMSPQISYIRQKYMQEEKIQSANNMSHLPARDLAPVLPPTAEKITQQSEDVGMSGFFSYADGKEKALALLAALFSAASGLFIPIFTSEVANATSVIQSSLQGDIVLSFLNEVGLKFLYFGISMLVCNAASNTLWYMIAEKQATAIRKAYFNALIRQELEFYDKTAPTTVLSSFSNDLEMIQTAIGNKMGVLCQIVGCLIGTLVYIFTTAWLLSLVCLGMLPFTIGAGYFYLKSYEGRTTEFKRIYQKAGELSQQAFFGIKTIKQMNAETRQAEKYAKQLQEVADKQFRISAKIGLSIGAMNFCFFSLNALVYWFGSQCMLDSQVCPSSTAKQTYSPKTVTEVFYLILNCYYLVVVLTPTLSSLNQGKQAVCKVLRIIDREPAIKTDNEGGLVLQDLKGVIKFIGVSFAYPSNKNKRVLNNVNFEFSVRNNVLLGQSGCGKSTVIQLVLRLYDPDEGVILVDGHDIKTYNLRWLRGQMGFVEQEPLLFAGSIQANFLLYCPQATKDDIDEALKQAEAYDFVHNYLQFGLKTEVGMRGQQLSGGQKQRIALARALLKKPKIMLFDEFTSALDQQNQRRILRNLAKLPYKMNILSITHRPQVMKSSDYAYHMLDGEILQEGKYDSLDLYQAFMMMPSTTLRNVLSKASMLKRGDSLGEAVAFEIARSKSNNLRLTELECFQIMAQEGPEMKKMKTFLQQALLHFIPSQSEQEETEQQMSLMALMYKIFSYNQDKRYLFVFAFLLSFMVGLIIPAMSYVFSKIYVSLFKLTIILTYNDGLELRKTSLYIFVGLAVGYFILSFLQILYTYVLGTEITKNIRTRLYAKLLKMPMSWFENNKNNPGVLTEKLSQGCETISQLASVLVFVLTVMMTGVITCYTLGFAFCWQISLLGFAFFPFIILFSSLKSYYGNQISKVLEKVRQQSNTILGQSLVGIKTVTALNVANQLHKRYAQIQSRPSEEVFGLGVKMGLISAGGNSLNFALLGTLFYFTGQLLQLSDYSLNLEYLMVALFQCVNVSLIINSNYHFLPNITEAKQIAIDVLNYFDYEDEEMLQKRENSEMLTYGINQGAIQFKNVSFQYQNRGERIFHKLSFKLAPNKRYWIVGRSGCGKSTILSLLQRFYLPKQGEILIDHINIKAFDIHYLRSKYGAVGQEPILINDTIQECVRYGAPQANEEKILKACEQANAIKFIMKGEDSEIQGEVAPQMKPQEDPNFSSSNIHQSREKGVGFGKMVGFNGSHLSGGQKQRIAIARMLLMKPSILLFDEVTSALDPQNEMKMMALLRTVSQGKTTLNISHKLGTLHDHDEIVMMHEGKIVERGLFKDLKNKEGGYFTNLRKNSVQQTQVQAQ